ncbi:hypothetical protein CRUP_014809 [Coryphaenoides rupestris]|nr:hypothetical protein CRUP_014809 [Coryphaenoides rupestris]
MNCWRLRAPSLPPEFCVTLRSQKASPVPDGGDGDDVSTNDIRDTPHGPHAPPSPTPQERQGVRFAGTKTFPAGLKISGAAVEQKKSCGRLLYPCGRHRPAATISDSMNQEAARLWSAV